MKECVGANYIIKAHKDGITIGANDINGADNELFTWEELQGIVSPPSTEALITNETELDMTIAGLKCLKDNPYQVMKYADLIGKGEEK